MTYAVWMPLHASALVVAALATGGDGWPSFSFSAARWPSDVGGTGKTYAVVTVDQAWSWHAARELAQAAGGDLTPITSNGELAFLLGLAQSVDAFTCVGPWVGGHRAPGQRWTWTDGASIGGFGWAPGRPAQSSSLEAVLCLVGDGAPDGTWADALPGADHGALVTSAMIRWESFVDCDGDGLPDALEILADPALDQDWDGSLDDCTPILDEDINQDGRVNGIDLGLLLSSWGPVSEPPVRADITRDGVVDGADFSRLLAAWTG